MRFFLKKGGIIYCFYVDRNNLVERLTLMIKREVRIVFGMFLSRKEGDGWNSCKSGI